MSLKSNIFRKVDIVFAFSIIMLTLLVYLTFKSAEEVRQGRHLERRTNSIYDKLDHLLQEAIEMETGGRNFAITGRERYLTPFSNSKTALTATIDSLNMLVSDEVQQKRLDTLTALLDEKMQISQHVVAIRQNFGRDSAVTFIEQGEGTRIMDSIRVVVARAEKLEQRQMIERIFRTDSMRYQREKYFTILSLFSLMIILTAYVLTRRNFAKMERNKKIRESLIDELAYQNKQLDDFAHMTSHNIRGPAANIGALVAMMKEDSTLEDYRFIFAKIKKVASNLTDTHNELLSILQVKRNEDIEKTLLHFEPVFLREKENMTGTILATGATLTYDFTAAPTVTFPKAYLESILHNLISNAFKYRAEDRPLVVTVKTEQKQGHTVLYVTDNGLGIDLTRHGDKLFGMRKTFHEHPEARGIGLFLTKTQIESMGGKISVKSKVNEGTTFIVQF